MQRSQTIFIGCLQICSVLLNTNFKMTKKSLFFFDLVVSKGYPSNEHHRRLKLGKPLVCRTINSHKLEMSHLNIKKEKKKKKKTIACIQQQKGGVLLSKYWPSGLGWKIFNVCCGTLPNPPVTLMFSCKPITLFRLKNA